MKIKINLSEAHFISLLLEAELEAENGRKEDKLVAQDILNKINK